VCPAKREIRGGSVPPSPFVSPLSLRLRFFAALPSPRTMSESREKQAAAAVSLAVSVVLVGVIAAGLLYALIA